MEKREYLVPTAVRTPNRPALRYPGSHCNVIPTNIIIQGCAEPTDIFQMVIDNIWKQEKISETVYKYVQVCCLLPTHYTLIFCKFHQVDGLRCIALLQACLEVAVHAPP
jgi:hypothetical protein